jgi:hypothetical protein
MTILQTLKDSVDISALTIALFGALFSIASALYLTARKISAEFRFRRADLSNIYAQNILSARLQRYPELWRYLSDYAKVLEKLPKRDGTLHTADLESLLRFNHDVSRWDSEHAFLLSTNAAGSCFRFLRTLREVLNGRSAAQGGQPITHDEYLVISEGLARLEVALRTDLGIHEIEKLEARKILRGYGEVARHTGITVESERVLHDVK